MDARGRVRQVQPPCLAVDGVADALSPAAEGCAVTEWPTEADGGFAWWQVRVAGGREAWAEMKTVLEYSPWAAGGRTGAARGGGCDGTGDSSGAALGAAPYVDGYGQGDSHECMRLDGTKDSGKCG
jgi:hypothetical protein